MILKIAHRGASGLKPENTLSAFRKALDFNIDMIECDARALKGGEVVIIHDRKVNRTTNGKGKIGRMTFGDIKSLEISRGEKIPTLDEVLDLVNRRVKVNIEIKGRYAVEPVASIIEKWLKKGWKPEDFLVSSFNYSTLKRFKSFHPEIKLALNSSKKSFLKLKLAERLQAFSVNLKFKAANHNFIKKAQKRGLKVLVWTVNEEKDIERAKSMKVDGIFSDYPSKLC